ncbi:MAG: SDR family oxidoreductase [Chthoniobacterales bacterium]
MKTIFSNLDSKTIWVTGGAGYLGTPIILALENTGAKVVCIDLPDKAEALCAKHNLINTIPESADLSNIENLPALVEQLTATHGIPDGFVHLAFVSSSGKHLEELNADDFNRTLSGGVTVNFILCRELAGRMQPGSSLVLFSSMYGIVSPDPGIYKNEMKPNPIDYGTSKAGILQMMRYFAVHYGSKGIRFNCITPGAFPSPAVQTENPDFIKLQRQKIPLNRPGNAEEIAGPTLFLLSDASSYVTGHSLVVDGGWTVW